MKTKHIFWGLFLVTLGSLYLIQNVFSLTLAVDNLHNFWPLVLVLIGLNVIIKNQIGKILLSGISAVLLGLVIFSLFNNSWCGLKRKFEHKHFETQNYSIPYDKKIKKVNFKFEGGAVAMELNSDTNDLIYIDGSKLTKRFSVYHSTSDSEADIKVNMKDLNIDISDSSFVNDINIKLNKEPEYDLKFEFGAASLNLDLEKIKVENLDIGMGAASLNVKLGEPIYETTNFKLNSGASSIKIGIPKNVGCKINTDAPLSTKDFEGFTEINDDEYITSNYDKATKKIVIDFNGGVTSISVYKY